MSIKPHIEGQATFQYFRDSSLWYKTDSGFLFPVPISDIGGTTFDAEMKALLMMRWIRKELALRTEA